MSAPTTTDCPRLREDRSHPALVVVIDDHPLIASGLRDLIAACAPGVEVVTLSSISASLQVLRASRPRLVVLDLGLPDVSNRAAIQVVRRAAPDALIAALGEDEEGARAIPEIHSGLVAFLCKGWRVSELQRCMHAMLVHCGAIGRAAADEHPHDRLAGLSPKQRKILALLATGGSNQDIAKALKLSPQTIKTHLSDIFSKLGVKNRTQAAMLDQAARREHAA